eukprot:ANDGO_05349.mRNA.1 hypothetical protein
MGADYGDSGLGSGSGGTWTSANALQNDPYFSSTVSSSVNRNPAAHESSDSLLSLAASSATSRKGHVLGDQFVSKTQLKTAKDFIKALEKPGSQPAPSLNSIQSSKWEKAAKLASLAAKQGVVMGAAPKPMPVIRDDDETSDKGWGDLSSGEEDRENRKIQEKVINSFKRSANNSIMGTSGAAGHVLSKSTSHGGGSATASNVSTAESLSASEPKKATSSMWKNAAELAKLSAKYGVITAGPRSPSTVESSLSIEDSKDWGDVDSSSDQSDTQPKLKMVVAKGDWDDSEEDEVSGGKPSPVPVVAGSAGTGKSNIAAMLPSSILSQFNVQSIKSLDSRESSPVVANKSSSSSSGMAFSQQPVDISVDSSAKDWGDSSVESDVEMITTQAVLSQKREAKNDFDQPSIPRVRQDQNWTSPQISHIAEKTEPQPGSKQPVARPSLVASIASKTAENTSGLSSSQKSASESGNLFSSTKTVIHRPIFPAAPARTSPSPRPSSPVSVRTPSTAPMDEESVEEIVSEVGESVNHSRMNAQYEDDGSIRSLRQSQKSFLGLDKQQDRSDVDSESLSHSQNYEQDFESFASGSEKSPAAIGIPALRLSNANLAMEDRRHSTASTLPGSAPSSARRSHRKEKSSFRPAVDKIDGMEMFERLVEEMRHHLENPTVSPASLASRHYGQDMLSQSLLQKDVLRNMAFQVPVMIASHTMFDMQIQSLRRDYENLKRRYAEDLMSELLTSKKSKSRSRKEEPAYTSYDKTMKFLKRNKPKVLSWKEAVRLVEDEDPSLKQVPLTVRCPSSSSSSFTTSSTTTTTSRRPLPLIAI